MKPYTTTAILACAFAVISPQIALGQWDYNQSIIDNMIDSRLDRRRFEARMKARRNGRRSTSKKSTNRKRTTGRKRAVTRKIGVATKPITPPLPPYGIEITRDTWQDFGREDFNGFKVNFTLTSVATGKTISKSAYCKIDTGYQTDSTIEGIPAGTYMVRAEVPHKGTKYQAHIGSKEGSTENPRGGDFAPSFKIVLKPIIDEGGSRVMGITPAKIYVRVLEESGVKWTKP